MSSPKLHLSILKGFLVGEALSSHNGVRCYPAIARDTEEKYILKIISVPDCPDRLEALLLTGALADKKAALDYFKTQAQDILSQVDILKQLGQQEGFWPYLDGQLDQMEEGTGYEVYLLGTYKHALDKILTASPMTHADAIQMGLDLCAALAACRRAGYLYADLKPGNIFYEPELGFRIGDVGFIAMGSLKYASLPDKYRSSYTAPELADDMAVLNSTVDIYALGLILYQAYNGGVLPFTGMAPAEELPYPQYADYELAGIISKACHPDPAQRWQDPTALAQALIGYMQEFGAPEEAIVPLVLPVEAQEEVEDADQVEEFLPEADDAQLQQELEELELELALMQASGEATIDGEHIEDIPEDISDILAQADALIAHELPEPPVAPEPIEVPIPAPIALDPEPVEEDITQYNPEEVPAEEDTNLVELEEVSAKEDTIQHEPEETPDNDEDTAQEETEEPIVLLPVQEISEDPLPSQISDEENTEVTEKAGEAEDEEKKQSVILPYLRRILTTAAMIVLLVALFLCGKHYYETEYLLHVDGIVLDAKDTSVSVQVLSQLDDSQIYVVCTDIYGNATKCAVVDGVAQFADLNPGTLYTVRVEPVGYHKLVGNASDSFTTAPQIQILSFTAGIGPEDCSVMLNVTVNGHSDGNWAVTYSADGIAEKVQTFTGRNVVISDLTEGALYTFTLSSQDGMYLTGHTQVSYLATDILYAKNLTVTACGNGELTVTWEQPENANVQQWLVRCYDETGYNTTVTTTDLSYTFTGLDHSTACTVEVTAEGMSRSVSTSISANPVTITDFHCTLTEDMTLAVSWDYTAQLPVAGWVLRYSIDGGAEMALSLEQNSAAILAVPNGIYTFTIEAADGTDVFENSQSHTVSQIESFANYGVSTEEMNFTFFLLPEGDSLGWKDIPEDSFRSIFMAMEKAGILITLPEQPESSKNTVNIQLVLHSDDGAFLRTDSIQLTWNKLWKDGHCCLQLPYMPETSGSYILTLYFDGQFLWQQYLLIS